MYIQSNIYIGWWGRYIRIKELHYCVVSMVLIWSAKYLNRYVIIARNCNMCLVSAIYRLHTANTIEPYLKDWTLSNLKIVDWSTSSKISRIVWVPVMEKFCEELFYLPKLIKIEYFRFWNIFQSYMALWAG